MKRGRKSKAESQKKRKNVYNQRKKKNRQEDNRGQRPFKGKEKPHIQE